MKKEKPIIRQDYINHIERTSETIEEALTKAKEAFRDVLQIITALQYDIEKLQKQSEKK